MILTPEPRGNRKASATRTQYKLNQHSLTADLQSVDPAGGNYAVGADLPGSCAGERQGEKFARKDL